MSEKLRKFVARAPRYLLRPQDHNVMRFSLEHTGGAGGIEQTILIDLSETGVAFLISPEIEPKLGERLKIEIPVPAGEQIAWWGRVVRIQEYEPRDWFRRNDPFVAANKILVAVKFEALPEVHTRAIRRGLEKSFMQAMRDQQYRTSMYYKTLLSQYTLQAIIYFLLTAFAVGFIYWFTIPDAKYDAKRGTLWGERFKF